MAERTKYPQIPSTVWWGIRSILNKTPSAKIDERFLSIQLDVQEAAARAYIGELKFVGIINDEGRATPLAQKWRLDETYNEAVEEIIEAAYPEGLRAIAPPGDADRQKAISWFQREGLGQGSAGNKAATYLLLSSPTPNEAPKPTTKPQKESGISTSPPARRSKKVEPPSAEKDKSLENPRNVDVERKKERSLEAFPLNINVQIHISSDAGQEQIESIFQAMRRYLYDAPNS